eukprot:gb/GECH01010936.1/.p1 GENE.gb/GECH01010936.1/~~gb/GECH01010936.1/.p1  ORF type:complete len:186 (+),score=15.65 gb/GECH01010936.1/:1-558(+)
MGNTFILIAPHVLWSRYFILDRLTLEALTTSITYKTLILGTQEARGWPLGGVVTYPILIFTSTGHLRIMLKYFPLTFRQIFLVKINRLLQATIFVCGQTIPPIVILIKQEKMTPTEQNLSALQGAYFAATLAFIFELMNKVWGTEQDVRKRDNRTRPKPVNNSFPSSELEGVVVDKFKQDPSPKF